MSRTDHLVARFQRTMGDSWWWRRYADMVDRECSDGSYRPFDKTTADHGYVSKRNRYKYGPHGKPPGLPGTVKLGVTAGERPPLHPRPAGMTRQMHRRLYREACKIAGVEYVPAYPPRPEHKVESPAEVEATWKAYRKDAGIEE